MEDHEGKIIRFQSLFDEEILTRQKQVDPYYLEDWYSLALGWAIAKGMTLDEAHEFAGLLRYKSEVKYIRIRF